MPRHAICQHRRAFCGDGVEAGRSGTLAAATRHASGPTAAIGSDRADRAVDPDDGASFAALTSAAARGRLGDLAAVPGVDVRSGDGWLAVCTGGDSNDLNGVLAEPGVVPTSADLMWLREWFAGLPATWHASEPDPALTAAMTQAGWQAERTGRCAGRDLPMPPPDLAPEIEVRRVETDADLDAWIRLASECGWFSGVDQRTVRRRLAYGLPWLRWIATLDGDDVGLATGWWDEDLAEIVDIAVLPSARRRGVGSALLATVGAWADTARYLVVEPSPDGWRLMAARGFQNEPTIPDTAFYLS